MCAAIGGLTPSQRDVVLCCYAFDLSIRETAAKLGMTPGVVKSLQWRAIQHLRRALEADRVPNTSSGWRGSSRACSPSDSSQQHRGAKPLPP